MQISPFNACSLFSWVLLSVTALVSFGVPKVHSLQLPRPINLDFYVKQFWITFGFYLNILDNKNFSGLVNFPILMNYYIYFISFVVLAILIVLSCSIMFYYTIRKGNEINGMFGTYSRFHMVPLLCASAIYIIGECQESEEYESNIEASLIFNLIFSIIGICTLIAIHLKTDLSSNRINNCIIKQMTYGWLFVIFVYNLFFGIYKYGNKKIESVDRSDFSKNCSLAFCIVMGLFNLAIAFLLKNAVICIANCFLYLGMTIWFFNLPEIAKDNGDAEGIIDIIMMILSLAVPSFLIFKYKAQVLG